MRTPVWDLAHLDRASSLQLGVATSAFQSEGGYNLGGASPATNWRAWERGGRVEVSGHGSALWTRFDEAARRAHAMGLTWFRLSVEWSRLCPDHGTRVSPRAADQYAQRLTSLRRHRLEPLVTLHHFTHPAALDPDLWLTHDAPERFARYCADVVTALNDALARRGEPPLRRMLTLNEPNMLALATYAAGVFPHVAASLAGGDLRGLPRTVRALDHLLASHVRAYRAIHAVYQARGWGTPDVSTNLNFIDLYGLSKGLFDLLRAPSLGVSRAALQGHLDASRARFHATFFAGEVDAERAQVARAIDDLWSRMVPARLYARTLAALDEDPSRAPLDHLAMDLYDPYTAHQLAASPALCRALAARGDLGAAVRAASLGVALAAPWQWRVEPGALARAVETMTSPGPVMDVDIDENGFALERPVGESARPRDDGWTRPKFLRAMLSALIRARVESELPVRTWCCWTLVDNYELGHWAPRFGLFAMPDDGGTWPHHDAAGDDAAGVIAAVTSALSRTGDARREALRDALDEDRK